MCAVAEFMKDVPRVCPLCGVFDQRAVSNVRREGYSGECAMLSIIKASKPVVKQKSKRPAAYSS